ncbi:armadillo-type protein [Mycena rebaudengoi]|nr:armadillo-type protein [Mycena rebaudengoi]
MLIFKQPLLVHDFCLSRCMLCIKSGYQSELGAWAVAEAHALSTPSGTSESFQQLRNSNPNLSDIRHRRLLPKYQFRRAAANALHQISQHSLTALSAVLTTDHLSDLVTLVKLPEEDAQIISCVLLGDISSIDDSTRRAVISAGACFPLSRLLSHSNSTVCLAALIVVCQISTIRFGAEIIVGIGAVPPPVALLDHDDTEVLRLTCDTISHIALQPDLLQALIDADVCGCLVALLLTRTEISSLSKDYDLELTRSAVRFLYLVSSSPGGARAAADSRAVVLLVNLLQSPDRQVAQWTSQALAKILDEALADEWT